MRASTMLKFRLPMKKINFITIKYENKDREFYNYLSKYKDLSKYFNGKSQNAEDYAIYYSDKNDYKNENQLLLDQKKILF